jgi:hypothetical protein
MVLVSFYPLDEAEGCVNVVIISELIASRLGLLYMILILF